MQLSQAFRLFVFLLIFWGLIRFILITTLLVTFACQAIERNKGLDHSEFYGEVLSIHFFDKETEKLIDFCFEALCCNGTKNHFSRLLKIAF